MEAIILAGGKAERLGDAAGNRPKALVSIAGRPLAAYQVALLAQAGVDRVVVSCAVGTGALFEEQLNGLGAEIVSVEEAEPLGRGGGLRHGATALDGGGDVYALNGDELVSVDFHALLERHRTAGVAATITVTRPSSPFAVVELSDDGMVAGFNEVASVPYWVSCGVYVLGPDAVEGLPERGDHETTTFPALAAAGRLGAFRYEGVWITVNTPKDLRRAEEYVSAHPDWLGGMR